jgi:UDP-N-acetylmuramyl tripeptide synthase
MDLLATWLGKVLQGLLRLLGRTGGTLPGGVVERWFPGYLARQLATLPDGVVLVSGTNGKTTTTKMLAHLLAGQRRVLTNASGSNFTRGVVTAVAAESTWSGRLERDVAVLELDEAYAVRFVEQVPPDVVVVLNVMRDQMDRFGEIDHTARLLGRAVAAATRLVVLNRDDPRVAALAAQAAPGVEVHWFGVAPALRAVFRSDDELHADPTEGAPPPEPTVADATLEAWDGERAAYATAAGPFEVALRVGGVHNAQNAAAVAAAGIALGLGADEIRDRLASVEPAFGRGERLTVDGRQVVLQLAKNPGGFRLALLSGQALGAAVTVLAINDEYADGRDVSWLWDVDFSGVGGAVVAAGTRAADMALRLAYDEVPVAFVEADLDAAFDRAVALAPVGGTVVVYTTYTAMWSLHERLRDGRDAVSRGAA